MAAEASVIYDKVTFLSKLPMLAQATSDDEVPIPGYMYQEINQLTLQSGSHCQTLLDYMVDRLSRKSYHIKVKVLKILAFLVEHGHPEFRQGLRKRSTPIVEATKFSGPPDPLHGQAPYLMVRKLASELSKQLFDVNADDAEVPTQQPVVQHITGGMGYSESNTSNTGKMQGFGNVPNKPDRTLGTAIVKGLKELAVKVLDPQEDTYRIPPQSATGHYKPITLDVVSNPIHVTSSDHQQHGFDQGRLVETDTRPHETTQNTAYVEGTTHLIDSRTASNTSSIGSQSFTKNPVSSQEGLDSKSSDELSKESQLVENFVKETTTMIPTRKQIKDFINRCSSLNCEFVTQYIGQRLASVDDEKTAMAYVILLEYLLRSELVTLDHFGQTCLEALKQVQTGNAGQIQSKAKKIILQFQKLTEHQTLRQQQLEM